MADIKGDADLLRLEKELKVEQFKYNIKSAQFRIATIKKEIETCNANIDAWKVSIENVEKELENF